MRDMRGFQKIAHAITFIGQLGFMVVTPPLVLIYLAYLAQTKLGWGVWVMILAIVAGLLCAGCSVYNFCCRTVRQEEKKNDPPPTGFNRHD